MKTLFQHCTKGLVISTAVWATACSDVNFTPSDPNQSFELADGSQKESFAFNDDGSGAKVDVLFVVDNSGSMFAEQQRLGAALSSFIGSIGNTDWQIGVTTTDVSDGPWGLKGSLIPFPNGSKVLSKRVPNYPAAFQQTVVRQEVLTCNNADKPCPSGDERPLQATVNAFEKARGENAALFRQGADVAVVVLSDENEGSDGTNAIAAQAVMNAFATVFLGSRNMSGYGIIVQPGNTACFNEQNPSGGKYGTYVDEFARLSGGVTGSICDADFGPALASIGNRVKEMSKSVTLRLTPEPNTVQIVIRPFDSSLTWVITGNTITFNQAPKKGTSVDVIYLPKR